ncbi:ornithine carbamoyltransferase [Candidatus Gottesmanbacteria bacterium]|nr:ornithine carbamoyltransferase [Candidatus Gottesmanbacteria bacterium]
MKKDFLSILDLSAKEILYILALAKKLKLELKVKGSNDRLLASRTLVMIFEKPSLRTRLSFEVGMAQLGGHAVYLAPSDIGIGDRESVSDIAKIASTMGNIIMARTYKHDTVLEFAQNSLTPVINGLSDLEHPCQILADLLTISEIKGKFKGLKLAFLGDGENNVTHSLALASSLLGINFSVASPNGFQMKREIKDMASKISSVSGSTLIETKDPGEAVEGADVVYTDTWVSMGDETEKQERLEIFKPYQVTAKLMKLTKPDAIFMHDLPAYRGNEVVAEVIDGSQSVVVQQAENRLHVQKALIIHLLAAQEQSS